MHYPMADFNSRPSARGDAAVRVRRRCSNLFQFTPLREGRRWILPSIPTPRYFNSRPSARGDGAHRGGYASAV